MPKTRVIDPEAGQPPRHSFKGWLLADLEIKGTQGPHTKHETEHPWWNVMCLTRVDYFFDAWLSAGHRLLSGWRAVALGYPGARAADALLCAAYLSSRRSGKPTGEGSIAMLEHLLAWWNYVLSGEGDVAPVTQRSATPGGA